LIGGDPMPECVEEDVVLIECGWCGNEFDEEDASEAHRWDHYQDRYEDVLICPSCYESSHSCDCHGEGYYTREDMCLTCNGDLICRDGAEENYFWCAGCDDLYHIDDCRSTDWENFCPACYQEFDDENSGVRRWDYRPNFVTFMSDRQRNKPMKGVPTFGVEVEIVTDYTDRVLSMMDTRDGFWYFKEDGSVYNGFEIVSMPFTWEWAMKNQPHFDRMFELHKHGVKSYNTDCCGMHVHIGRQSFKTDLHLFKFMTLMYDDPDFILRISRRQKSRLEQWASTEKPRRPSYMVKNKNSDGRYRAVNLENRHTVEVRIFRGTVSRSGFWANLEFLHAAIEYSRHNSVNDMRVGKFTEWVQQRPKEYKRFINTLLYQDLEV